MDEKPWTIFTFQNDSDMSKLLTFFHQIEMAKHHLVMLDFAADHTDPELPTFKYRLNRGVWSPPMITGIRQR